MALAGLWFYLIHMGIERHAGDVSDAPVDVVGDVLQEGRITVGHCLPEFHNDAQCLADN